jgi:hypothetical protein
MRLLVDVEVADTGGAAKSTSTTEAVISAALRQVRTEVMITNARESG